MCVEAIASYIKAEDPSYYSEVLRLFDMFLLFVNVCDVLMYD